MSKCPFCSGNKIDSTTTFTVDLGFGIVVIRDVPATACELCGNDWIEDDIAQKLEEVVVDARKKHAMVEISRYEDLLKAS